MKARPTEPFDCRNATIIKKIRRIACNLRTKQLGVYCDKKSLSIVYTVVSLKGAKLIYTL